MNKVCLIGRMTADPELKYTPNTGTAVCIFTLAINRKITNKNGEREADFIPCVVYGKIGEAVANHMRKGRNIGINGRIQTRSYEDKEGNRRYITEVIAEEVDLFDWGGNKKSKSDGMTEDIDTSDVPWRENF